MRTPINRRRHADFDYCAHPLDIFVLLSFSLIFSFLYISYPPAPHSPLVISSCFTVFLLSLSPPLSPISLYKHPTPLANGPDVISFCVHSFTFYYPLYRYRTIPGTFICPLFGNASIPGPPTPVEFNDDLFGRLTGVVHTTGGCRSASLPRSSGFASLCFGVPRTIFSETIVRSCFLLPHIHITTPYRYSHNNADR